MINQLLYHLNYCGHCALQANYKLSRKLTAGFFHNLFMFISDCSPTVKFSIMIPAALCLPTPPKKILLKLNLCLVLCCFPSKLQCFVHLLESFGYYMLLTSSTINLTCTDTNTESYWLSVLAGGRCPHQKAHHPAPSAVAVIVVVVVPCPHGQKWTGPLLQDQNSGSGLTAGPLCQPHPHYSTDMGPMM